MIFTKVLRFMIPPAPVASTRSEAMLTPETHHMEEAFAAHRSHVLSTAASLSLLFSESFKRIEVNSLQQRERDAHISAMNCSGETENHLGWAKLPKVDPTRLLEQYRVIQNDLAREHEALVNILKPFIDTALTTLQFRDFPRVRVDEKSTQRDALDERELSSGTSSSSTPTSARLAEGLSLAPSGRTGRRERRVVTLSVDPRPSIVQHHNRTNEAEHRIEAPIPNRDRAEVKPAALAVVEDSSVNEKPTLLFCSCH
jgi:hypothetical protein